MAKNAEKTFPFVKSIQSDVFTTHEAHYFDRRTKKRILTTLNETI